VRSGHISDILLNKMILPEELCDNLIMSCSVCIISVSFCEGLLMRSRVNLAFPDVCVDEKLLENA